MLYKRNLLKVSSLLLLSGIAYGNGHSLPNALAQEPPAVNLHSDSGIDQDITIRVGDDDDIALISPDTQDKKPSAKLSDEERRKLEKEIESLTKERAKLDEKIGKLQGKLGRRVFSYTITGGKNRMLLKPQLEHDTILKGKIDELRAKELEKSARIQRRIEIRPFNHGGDVLIEPFLHAPSVPFVAPPMLFFHDGKGSNLRSQPRVFVFPDGGSGDWQKWSEEYSKSMKEWHEQYAKIMKEWQEKHGQLMKEWAEKHSKMQKEWAEKRDKAREERNRDRDNRLKERDEKKQKPSDNNTEKQESRSSTTTTSSRRSL
jgi:hypothetical protein